MQNEVPAQQLERYSMADRVANWLRWSIIKGELTPGTRLTEARIKEAFNVSATPVREAFRILQVENLLIHNAYSGVTVAEISPKYLSDVCEMRALVDLFSFDLIMKNLTPEGLDKLRATLDQVKQFDPQNIHINNSAEAEKFVLTELEFHACVSSLTGNYEIEATMRNLCKKAHIFRLMMATTFAKSTRLNDTIHELEDIYNAISNRNKAAFETAIRTHYERSRTESYRFAQEHSFSALES